MSNRGFLAVLAALAFVGLLGFGLIAKEGDAVEIGEPAPDAPVQLPRRFGRGQPGRPAGANGSWSTSGPRGASPAATRRRRSSATRASTQDDLDGRRHRRQGQHRRRHRVRRGVRPQLRALARRLRRPDGRLRDPRRCPESFLVDPEGNLALIQRGPVDERFLEANVTPLSRAGADEARLAAAATIAGPAGARVAPRSRRRRAADLAARHRGRGDVHDLRDDPRQLTEAPQAEQQRDLINELIAEGMTKDQIKAELVAEYGPEVLAVPERRGLRPRGLDRPARWARRRPDRDRPRGSPLAQGDPRRPRPPPPESTRATRGA